MFHRQEFLEGMRSSLNLVPPLLHKMGQLRLRELKGPPQPTQDKLGRGAPAGHMVWVAALYCFLYSLLHMLRAPFLLGMLVENHFWNWEAQFGRVLGLWALGLGGFWPWLSLPFPAHGVAALSLSSLTQPQFFLL